jgi:predicted unusual protein kinase regulating ubiquinone biosynthesis (AarF/ABC1/UbiB family)
LNLLPDSGGMCLSSCPCAHVQRVAQYGISMQVPEVLWAYTSQDVLTMEYAPGTKINRAAELDRMGVNRKLLAKRAVESYLQQLLTFGFFHAGGVCRSLL